MSSPGVPDQSRVEAALGRALAESGACDVVSAYLFGSLAEGREHRESAIEALERPDPVKRFLEIAAAIEAEEE